MSSLSEPADQSKWYGTDGGDTETSVSVNDQIKLPEYGKWEEGSESDMSTILNCMCPCKYNING